MVGVRFSYFFNFNHSLRRHTRRPRMSAHPAKFTDVLLEEIARHVTPTLRVLDPFAGTGRVHRLDAITTGVEIEPEWATLHPQTVVGDALKLPFADDTFDTIVTSPTYGNRMADHHNAKDGSRRMTYRHTLGRPLHSNNSGQLQWGTAYRSFHEKAWGEALRVLKPGGRFILNVSDHIRSGKRQRVTAWHLETLLRLGLEMRSHQLVSTPRMRNGANSALRVGFESITVLELA